MSLRSRSLAALAVLLGAALGATCSRAGELGSICVTDDECVPGAICETIGAGIFGQCTASCSDDAGCVALFGEGECQGVCLKPCASDEPCPTDTRCSPGDFCVPVCVVDLDCLRGRACIDEICR